MNSKDIILVALAVGLLQTTCKLEKVKTELCCVNQKCKKNPCVYKKYERCSCNKK